MGRRRTWTDDDLRRHIARLGLDTAKFPRVERHTRRRRGGWTDDDLRTIVAEVQSVSDVLRRLGYQPSGGMHRFVSKKIQNLGLDTSHFLGQSWNKGRRPNNRMPLAEILVENSTYTNTPRLRQRLITEGLKEPRCESCGLDEWLGEPLPLTLDHVNGDHTDNRIENLRILCPNCHALTPTWCRSRNSNGKPA